MVSTVNKTVLNTWNLLSGDLKCSHYKNKWQLCEMMKVLTNSITVITSQNTCVWNQHIVYLKETYYMSTVSQQMWGREDISQEGQ